MTFHLINAGAGGVWRPSPLLLRCQLTKVPCFVTHSLATYQNVHMISPLSHAPAMGAHTPGEYLVVRQKSLLHKHTESPPEAYDVIVVLGAAVWSGGQPSPALQRRILHAVDLLQQGYASYLLVTGGLGKYPPAEAVVMQRLAVAHGILPQHILCEDQATCTFASALRCCDILRQRGWSRVLVVTDRYHLPRTLFAFWICGLHAVGSAAPGKPARRLRRRWYYYLREGLALPWYLVRAVPILLRRRRQAGGPQRIARL